MCSFAGGALEEISGHQAAPLASGSERQDIDARSDKSSAPSVPRPHASLDSVGLAADPLQRNSSKSDDSHPETTNPMMADYRVQRRTVSQVLDYLACERGERLGLSSCQVEAI